MKRILTLICVVLLGSTSLNAQSTDGSSTQFYPYWSMQLQGGVGHTLGEADFGKLLSPAMALNGARQFTPVWGLRFGVSGWEAKGAWLTPELVYKFNFAQLNADVTVDLANWIGGYKFDRLVNPYVFLGVGANVAFNNGEAKKINDSGYELSLLWTGSKLFVAGRAGAGVNFRVSERVSLGVEVNTNMLSDKFNSKKAGNVDWQMNALAGISFRFGKGKKQVTTMVAPTTAIVEPIQEPAVEPTPVAEPVAVVEEPKPIVEPTPVVKPEPTPEPVVQAKTNAPTPPAPDTYKVRKDVLFAINSFVVRDSENPKIDALVECLKANPKSRVSVVGYADAPTGSSMGNYWLSGWRAIKVRDALTAKGISKSRIDMNFVGDREQPYSDVEDNRVVICIVR